MEEYPNTQSDMIVEAIPLRDQVADIVRRMILKGELKADEQISERAISQLLNVSTTPVKEAFRVLQTEGLLYVKPRRGSYVSTLYSNFMIQIAYMRSSLEGTAAFFAAMHATAGETALMEKALENAGRLIGSAGDVLEISRHNNKFHSILRAASRNEYLVSLINRMCSIDKTFRELSLMSDPAEPVRSFNEHRAILEALKSRDPEEVERRMVAHIRRIALLVVGPESLRQEQA